MKKFILAVLASSLLAYSSVSSANWFLGTANWFLKDIFSEVASEIIQNIFMDNMSKSDIAALQRKVTSLESRIDTEKRNGNVSSGDFRSMKNTLSQLSSLLNLMGERVTSMEQRLGVLEKKVTILEDTYIRTEILPKVQMSRSTFSSSMTNNSSGGHYVIVSSSLYPQELITEANRVRDHIGSSFSQKFNYIQVYPPYMDNSYYGLMIGAELSQDEACALQHKAKQNGFQCDTYIWNYSRNTIACPGYPKRVSGCYNTKTGAYQ